MKVHRNAKTTPKARALLVRYNRKRPHTSLNYRAPITRLPAVAA